MQGFDKLEVLYQLQSNMNACANTDSKVMYFRQSALISDVLNKKLQQSELDQVENSISAYESKMENLLDAYLIYSKSNKSNLENGVNKAKEQLVQNLQLEVDEKFGERAQKLQELFLSPELAFLHDQTQIGNLKKIIEAEHLNEQLQQKIAKLEQMDGVVDSGEINDLLKSSTKLATKQQKEITQKKSDNSKIEKTRTFIIEECKSKLAKKADKTADEVYIADNLDKLSAIELHEENGKEYLKVSFGNKKSMSLRLFSYKDKFFVLGNSPEALKNKTKVTELYNSLVEEGSLNLGDSKVKSLPAKIAKIEEEKFKTLVGIKIQELNEKEFESLKEEMAAYNNFGFAGDKSKAQELITKLKDKYAKMEVKAKIEEFRKKEVALKKVMENAANVISRDLKSKIKALDNKELVSLLAPARGGNTEEKKRRQKFGELFEVVLSDEKTKGFMMNATRQNLISVIKDDMSLWNDVRASYYKMIKDRARDNFFQVMTEKLFSGKMDVNGALLENSRVMSSELTKLILLRSTELYVLSKDEFGEESINKMNELHKALGYKIKRKKFKMAQNHSLRSKPLTLMLRCLADGRMLDSYIGEMKLDSKDMKYIKDNLKAYKKLLGADSNFVPLIEDVMLGKKQANPILSSTPYQKRYKTLGLLCAMSKNMKNETIEDALFSQVFELCPGDNINALKQKKAWKYDDYLFKNYLEIFHDKMVDLAAKTEIEALKADYGWEKFKTNNQNRAEQVAKEFADNTKNPAKLMSSMLVKGMWAARDEDVTIHHNDPLKYAVSSASPLDYNLAKNLVVTVQWKAWQPDFHKLEHLATIEGADCNNPYVVQKEKDKYIRSAQYDLAQNMEICHEKPMQRGVGGFEEIIPENTLLITSTGAKISSPEVPAYKKVHENVAVSPSVTYNQSYARL